MREIGIITLFPQMFRALESFGVTAKALQEGLISVRYFNPRDYTTDKHHTVDDKPYGGGPGMILKVAPLVASIRAARAILGEETPVYYLSPQAPPLTQHKVLELSDIPKFILIAGRYEGIDQRVIDHYIDGEISIGDYVLSGGELAAMVILDAVIRLIPEALGHPLSAEQDSHRHGLLDHPHYSRPPLFEGHAVPEVLQSGDHKAIQKWQSESALKMTRTKRPDLLK